MDRGQGSRSWLDRYLVAAAVVGVGVAALVFVRSPDPEPTVFDLGRAALLLAAAFAAERFTQHLTRLMSVNVGMAVYLAMALVLPPAWPGLLAAVAIAAGQGARRRGDPVELAFEVGQGAAATATAATVIAALVGPHRGADGPAFLAAIVGGAGAFFLVNSALVSLAASIADGIAPWRVWAVAARQDVADQAAMAGLGGAAAVLTLVQPVLLPSLVVPFVILHRATAENVRLRQDTHRALGAMVDIVELRDAYTAGHSRRVAALSREIAVDLGLTHQAADLIASAAQVHDIGKIAVDPQVLRKDGPLVEAEWMEMQRHPALGAEVVAEFEAFGAGHLHVRHHHEAWDGSGYPDALAADGIPLGARIIAVADTFDALTTDRPYRTGMSGEGALSVLRAGAERQWDPGVVAALERVVHVRARAATGPSPLPAAVAQPAN